MIVLDTNIVSEVQKPNPDVNVANWFQMREIEELYLCTPIIAELAHGGHRIRIRDKSDRYIQALETTLERHFGGRILDFDAISARIHGQIWAEQTTSGRSFPVIDLQIASICLANGASLATRNTKDFYGLGVGLINPFEHT